MLSSAVQRIVDEVIGPLVEQDAGELHIVACSESQLSLHLTGAFSGCPGNTLAVRRVIEPLVRAQLPLVRLHVTSGAIIPDGAMRWTPPETDAHVGQST
jgi:Fe-S cluster biogenesis protein NfuA